MGAEAHLNSGDHTLRTGDVRWLSPLPLWIGILAGPLAWAIDLCVSYALVKWICSTQRDTLLHLITPAALVIVSGGAIVSWRALRRTPPHMPTDGGDPRQRARFMAIMGLTSSALFATTILAGAVPRWVIDACQ